MMTPSAADLARPVPDIAGKRLASDLDKPHDCACKNRAARRAQQSTDNGKEANTEDHGKETNATKKLKRYDGFSIDMNKEPRHDDNDIESPPATAGGKRSASHQAVSSSENKKKELELDARRLRLEQKRAKWAIASWRKDMELEKMRLENERMKLANKQLQVKIKHRALELGMELEMI
jgi:hypothetical protein